MSTNSYAFAFRQQLYGPWETAQGPLIEQFDQLFAALNANAQSAASAPAWTTIPYSAAIFSGRGSMTWTVTYPQLYPGDSLSYVANGPLATVNFRVFGSSVGGVLNDRLYIQIPQAVAAIRTANAPFYYQDNGTFGAGLAVMIPATLPAAGNPTFPSIQLFKADRTNWSLSTNKTDACGQITFQIAG